MILNKELRLTNVKNKKNRKEHFSYLDYWVKLVKKLFKPIIVLNRYYFFI